MQNYPKMQGEARAMEIDLGVPSLQVDETGWESTWPPSFGVGLSTNFSVKGRVVNILGFVDCMVTIITIQPQYCSVKAATDDT